MMTLLGEKYPSLQSKINDSNKAPIRFLEVFNESKPAKTWFDSIITKGNVVVEASRLSVSTACPHRSAARVLVEAALAIFLTSDQSTFGAMEVMEHHVPFYQHLGFKPITQRFQPDIRRFSYLIAGHNSTLPNRFQDRFTAMRNEWENSGFLANSLNKS